MGNLDAFKYISYKGGDGAVLYKVLCKVELFR